MLVFGAASQAWETLSALQPANASAAAAGIGVEPFVTDTTSPTAAAADPVQSVPPPTGTIGQASLSPDVLGFLIWNQSQQPGVAPSASGSSDPAATNGASNAPATTTGGADTSGITAWPPFQSWFSPFSSDGTAAVSSAPNAASGGNGSTSPTVTWPSQSTAGPSLATGESGAAPESSGAHGHHHHHAGFAIPSQSDQSDPLANLLGVAAQGASSTTAANADGSTTTTITYADGSEVTLTSAPQVSSTNPGPTAAAAQLPINSNSFLATLIQLQARLLAPSAAA